MKRYHQIAFGLIFLCVTTLSIFGFINFKNLLQEKTVSSQITYGTTESESTIPSMDIDSVTDLNYYPEKSIYVTGDIMLARHVEYLMTQNGDNYPYRGLDFIDKNNSFVVGNFEASIPEIHQKTPNYTFRFSVNKKFLPSLREAGFTHLSLANNHSFDFGGNGYRNTQNTLSENNLIPFGHPTILSTSSVTFINTGVKTISFIALHTLYVKPTEEHIVDVIGWAQNNSDYTVAYVHWGNEYELNQSNTQRQLAKTLVKAGADLIIGHHPHVVQGIEKIEDKLVFYSLGNLIFDQYFSEEVRSGLILKLTFDDNVKIKLIPVNSKRVLAQPHETLGEEKTIFLKKLANRSSPELQEQIEQGKITLNVSLATSTEKVIID